MTPTSPTSAPSTPLDTPAPIARITRLRRLTFIAGGVLVALSAAWALLPLRPIDPPSVTLDQVESKQGPESREAPLNLAAFDAAIWVAPPPDTISATETAPPPPPARITLELIAIERSAGALRAALYDPGAKKLHTAAAGETIAGHELIAIDDNGVTLTIQGREGVLELRQEQEPIQLDSLRRIGRRDP